MSLTTTQVVDKAETLAQLLLDLSVQDNLVGNDLIVVLSLAQRLVHSVVGGHKEPEYVLNALQEADATFKILTGMPELD
jgi:hypothetical protein